MANSTNPAVPQYIHQFLIAHAKTCASTGRNLHVHPNAYEITLFKSGNVDFFINDNTYHPKPGELVFVRPNEVHGYFAKDDTLYERLPVHIEESAALNLSTSQTNLLTCFADPMSCPYHLTKEQVQMYESLVDNSIDAITQNSFGCDVLVRANMSMLLLLVNSVIRQSRESSVTEAAFPKIIQDAIAYINLNFTNDISIQEIADHLNISHSRLCHVFKEQMGISLWNYVISLRVQHAQMLLKQGTSITTTCYESGFQNYAHFVKVFGKFTGTSPGKYIKNYQNYCEVTKMTL
jgi:YesN/AraC family two-component response regulator